MDEAAQVPPDNITSPNTFSLTDMPWHIQERIGQYALILESIVGHGN